MDTTILTTLSELYGVVCHRTRIVAKINVVDAAYHPKKQADVGPTLAMVGNIGNGLPMLVQCQQQ